MNNTTNAAKTAIVDPCAWDIALTWEDGRLAGVSVRRTDGLAFEHLEWQVADHVRATLAVRGLDAGRQPATFTRGGRVCVVLDA